MNKKAVWIVLVISLAFNAFFLAGFQQSRKQMASRKTFRGRAEAFAQKLQLDEQQHEKFQALLDEAEQLREGRTAKRDAFWKELIKDEPDEDLLADYMYGKTMQEHRRTTLALMRKFVGILRPEQREEFVELIQQKQPSRDKEQKPGREE